MSLDPVRLADAIRLHQGGQYDEARGAYEQLLAANPTDANLWQLLGLIDQQTGNFSDGRQRLERAISLDPALAEAHTNLGTILQELGELDAALEAHGRAITLNPLLASAYFNLANTQRALGDLQGAEHSYRQAIQLNPQHVKAYNNLAVVLRKQLKLAEARLAVQRALELDPEHPQALLNLGNVFLDMGQLAEAEGCYRQLLGRSARLARMHIGLDIVAAAKGEIVEASRQFRQVMGESDAFPEARANLSFLLLLEGDFERGWEEYEWRWRVGDDPEPDFGCPRWSGEALSGKTLLLWAEQGFGDSFQFVRYAPLLQERGARVVVRCQPPLEKILARSPGFDQLVTERDPLPAVDFHIPMLGVPRVLRTTLETIPASAAYITADPELVEYWRQRLHNSPAHRSFSIGINWRGRPGHGSYRLRDIPLEAFEDLAQLPHVSFVSLQKGDAVGELRGSRLASGVLDLGNELDTTHGAFMDTAAIMKNLDLVITSDTAIAHLGGALAVPTWVALPYVPDWRWLLNRGDSPWYPTMRLFRQPSPGHWPTVFREICTALNELLHPKTN